MKEPEEVKNLRRFVAQHGGANVHATADGVLVCMPPMGEVAIQRVVQDRKDAERYRWLRDEAAGHLHVYRGAEEDSLLPAELDAAIDAAIAAADYR